MRIVKSEWHQVEKRYALEVDENLVSEVFPDLDEDEVAARLEELKSGEYDVEEFVESAWENDVYIEWDWLDEDDWWTDRKGGYEVTYEVDKGD